MLDLFLLFSESLFNICRLTRLYPTLTLIPNPNPYTNPNPNSNPNPNPKAVGCAYGIPELSYYSVLEF